jgi:hypothetical protein
MIPDYWSEFIESNNLVGKEFDIPTNLDQSDIKEGVLKFFDEKEIEEESNEYFPGIGVRASGFIAVACCMRGSGDPYFINLNDGANGKLYRVYHDAKMIDDYNYDLEDAVNIVLKDYSEILS